MGEVYRSRRLSDGHVVAVKVLHPHLTDDTSISRLRREAQVTERLSKGLAPALYEIGSVENQHFIAMEYLRGEDLGTFLRREAPLAFDHVTKLVNDVARTVEAVHSAGVVHRDLKPQNVFLVPRSDGAPAVSLLDFGIAKIFDAAAATLTSGGALIGTPGYMAPEQARGDPEIGPPADVFALGVIAYYALVGERPFAARFVLVALHETMTVTPQMPSPSLRAGLPAGTRSSRECSRRTRGRATRLQRTLRGHSTWP
jgi:serine/threonine-protein kinase